MRKVTGYIGALIVVIALMGSILSGYALNVNGTTEIVNKYQDVTDVSGLYSHTEEKKYIDYNPASNYIGYDESKYNSDAPVSTGKIYYKELTGDFEFTISTNGTVTADGHTYPASTIRCVPFICDKFYLQHSPNTSYILMSSYDLPRSNLVGTVTVSKVGNTVTVTDEDGYNEYWSNNTKCIRLSDESDYNYYFIDTSVVANPTYGYYSDRNDIVTFSKMSPKYGGSSGSTEFISVGEVYYTRYVAADWTGFYNGYDMPSGGWMFTETEVYDSGIYRLNANFKTSSSSGWDNTGTTKTITEIFVLYPAYKITNGWAAIDYTPSSRVNNYPVEYEYQDNTEIQTLPQINLLNVSATNYLGAGASWTLGDLNDVPVSVTYNGYDYVSWRGERAVCGSSMTNGPTRYSLSDLIAIMDIPVGTTQIVFDTGDYSPSGITLNCLGGYIYNTGHTAPSNFVALVSSTTSQDIPMFDINYGWIAYYTVNTGLVDIYTTNGVKVSTSSLSDTYVQFTTQTYVQGTGWKNYATTTDNEERFLGTGWSWWSDYNNAQNPYLNVKAITSGVVENVTYLDPTKGISIKPDVSEITWNNAYENGNIKLLFRATNLAESYHNDLIVSGNSISVDYDGVRFWVTLNNDTPVDIGTWRSIVLDIDLTNGNLYAVPVRTFNSYTNVQMDNTSVNIGALTDAAPTNIITWEQTNDSFTFGVYSTSVFMNTYGIVMADPSITVTDYFTDLDNFYRLELTDFSIYGDSMTINNQTGLVTGNYVTFGDESVILKKMAITYADGHVYISDSNIEIDLGEIATNYIVFGGAWYFKTFLQKGFTSEKQVYTWDWQDFILNNTEFCIIYIGFALVGLVIARKFCSFSFMDYVVLGISIIIALGTQVIA